MKTTDNADNVEIAAAAPRVEFSSEVLRQIRQHARSSMNAEICGILLGTSGNGATHVTARIEGVGAVEAGTNVTFTQETWEHIFRVKDAQHPELSIVGWYHSHPGFGVFLSEYDIFIHENFFSGAHQVAWVFDPHSDEEGCFGWVGKSVKPLAGVSIRQNLRGQQDDADAEPGVAMPVKNGRKGRVEAPHSRSPRVIAIFCLALTVTSLAAGALIRPSFEKLAPRAWHWVRGVHSPPTPEPSPESSPSVASSPTIESSPAPTVAPSPTPSAPPKPESSAPAPAGEKTAPSTAPDTSSQKRKGHE